MSDPIHYDVLILGGGGAGLFCASQAGIRGRRVAVLEHQERVGKKIAISGGGRCNFTNLNASPAQYLSQNPDFCKSALARFSPSDFIALVERHGIRYHEKKLGQLFCDESARQIIQMLVDEASRADVQIHVQTQILTVSKPDRFRVDTSRGTFTADSLVVATGGLSFPKLGATPLGHQIAERFGLQITERRPGLVPLVFAPQDRHWGELSGVALPVRAQCGSRSFEEALLLTHRGISGPATLQISSYWRENQSLSLDLTAGTTAPEILTEARKSGLLPVLSRLWPRRFAERWCELYAPKKPLAQCRADELENLKRNLHAWQMTFPGTEGYPKAEVTLGGVDTRELSSKTMEARKVPGLYFIGEVVDVTGWLGGYNFQWAWASAHAAAQFA
jgi:predicted Rossmann fold flavoprotein